MIIQVVSIIYVGWICLPCHLTPPSNQHETRIRRTLQKVDFEMIFRFQPLGLWDVGGGCINLSTRVADNTCLGKDVQDLFDGLALISARWAVTKAVVI